MISKTAAGTWFIAQAVAGAAWWTWLLAAPEAWRPFWAAATPEFVWRAFAPADGVMPIGVSLVAGVQGLRRRKFAAAAGWAAAGAAAYAALLCAAMTWSTGEAWLGTVLMAGSAGCSIAAAAALAR